jgi:hypothetical protein
MEQALVGMGDNTRFLACVPVRLSGVCPEDRGACIFDNKHGKWSFSIVQGSEGIARKIQLTNYGRSRSLNLTTSTAQ